MICLSRNIIFLNNALMLLLGSYFYDFFDLGCKISGWCQIRIARETEKK